MPSTVTWSVKRGRSGIAAELAQHGRRWGFAPPARDRPLARLRAPGSELRPRVVAFRLVLGLPLHVVHHISSGA